MLDAWHNLSLADALGSVREEIRHLRLREAALRNAILAAPRPEEEAGREFGLQIRRGVSKRLNRKALPKEILENPRYWTCRETITVLTPATAPNTAQGNDRTEDPDDTFDVVEPF